MFADTYSDLALTFNEWLDNSPTGGEYVTNLTLDYANRAQDSIWSEPANGWTLLTRSEKLTIANLIATLPTGCGLLIHVYSDCDSDGKPDFYYFKDGRLIDGFKFIPGFTKASGHTRSIQFFQAPNEPIYCDYQVKLDAFAGTSTEYMFFPKSIMLGKMQYLRCLDKGMLNEWKALSAEYEKELSRFKSQHQNVGEMPGITINDSWGKEVVIPRHNLNYDSGGRGRITGSTNDRDTYRRY
jgi:hypothetical protein